MKSFDFTVQDKTPKGTDNNYVLLQAGKGKAKYSSLYVNPKGFSFLEGLIWDKYREFNREKRKNKIDSNEWERILDGFETASALLVETKSVSEWKSILKFDLTNPKYELEELLSEQVSFTNMLNELIEWLSRVISQEKYVYINYLG